jgi:uncharacterized membrane protein
MSGMSGNLFSKGGIAVRTNPSGASVEINEEYVGRAPLMDSREAGIYRVVVKKRGYETQEHWVDVPKGKTVELNLKLER